MAPTPTAAAAPAAGALADAASPAASFFKVAEFSPEGAKRAPSVKAPAAAPPARAPSGGIGSNGRPAGPVVSSAPRAAPGAAPPAQAAATAPEPAKGGCCGGKPKAEAYRLPDAGAAGGAAPTPAPAPAAKAGCFGGKKAKAAAAAAAAAGPAAEPPKSAAAAALPAAPYPIRVTVRTGDVQDGGTDADISLVCIGANGRTAELNLSGKGNNFERGKTDVFTLNAGANFGALQRIGIGYAKKWSALGAVANVFGDAWRLESVEVLDLTTGLNSVFTYGAWIDLSKPRVELPPSSQETLDAAPWRRRPPPARRPPAPAAPTAARRPRRAAPPPAPPWPSPWL